MTVQTHYILELMLKLLPVVIGLYSIFALVVACKGIQKARREAYEIKKADFNDLKRRVRRELNKDDRE